MRHGLAQFRRILKEFRRDPRKADRFVAFVVAAGKDGSPALQCAIQDELKRLVANDDPEPERMQIGPALLRVDPFLLSPGGFLLEGRYFGKDAVGEALGCTIDEGGPFEPLTREPFATAFAQIRDGISATSICDFDCGQAVFVSARPAARIGPREQPDAIIAMFFIKDDKPGSRRDRVTNLLPFAMAQVIRNFDPTRPKSIGAWRNATPDRRFLKLRGGRSISTRWYGPPRSTPVVVFGAIHKCTMADPYLANAALNQGLALLVVERPGLGASDPAAETRYEAVAEDVAEIVRALALREVLVFGAGTASSFALATAARLGDTVKAVALASPRIGRPTQKAHSPYGQLLWSLLDNSYGLDPTARLFRRMRVAGWAQSLMMTYAISNSRDRRILESPGMLDYLAAQTNDAVHKSVDGALAEFRLFQSGASFSPSRVAQPIRIWQGAEDHSLLIGDTERAFAHAPNAVIEAVEGGGIFMNETEAAAIAHWLASGWRAQLQAGKTKVG